MHNTAISKAWGELEIDHARGVIYFTMDNGHTVLRICRLPQVPKHFDVALDMLDITHMHGTSWGNV